MHLLRKVAHPFCVSRRLSFVNDISINRFRRNFVYHGRCHLGTFYIMSSLIIVPVPYTKKEVVLSSADDNFFRPSFSSNPQTSKLRRIPSSLWAAALGFRVLGRRTIWTSQLLASHFRPPQSVLAGRDSSGVRCKKKRWPVGGFLFPPPYDRHWLLASWSLASSLGGVLLKHVACLFVFDVACCSML